MCVTRASVAASLVLSACGLNTFGLTDGPADTTATMSDSATTPTGEAVPEASTLQLSFSQVKQFDFSWSAPAEAEYYQLLERPTLELDYTQLGEDIIGSSISLTMPLHLRLGASYLLRACNAGGCTDSDAVEVVDSMTAAVGYFKASNSESYDYFGAGIALSGDGNTLVVGAGLEDGPGPGGDQGDNSVMDSGAVYVFVREDNAWSQQAYLKASSAGAIDYFGYQLAISHNGDTLAISADNEDSAATMIGGDQADNEAFDAGAVYVFVRASDAWSQQAYLKASNTGKGDNFGIAVAMSADGNTVAVGASAEDSDGIKGDQTDNSTLDAGAVYVFGRNDDIWSQQAYLKASLAGEGDLFGHSLALSANGDTLAVGAPLEDSDATNVDGDQADNSANEAGAVYVFGRVGEAWSKPTYLKASNTDASDRFGVAVAVSADGNTLAVGAQGESSNATGIDGAQADDSVPDSGAVYVFAQANSAWSQKAYVKTSNSGASDNFGSAVALSADGNTLAVGAYGEASAATGIGGDQADNSAKEAGAVYVFIRSSSEWLQRAYVKASNSDTDGRFGYSLALSAEGNTLAVGAYFEDSASVDIGGDQADNAAPNAGAVYLY